MKRMILLMAFAIITLASFSQLPSPFYTGITVGAKSVPNKAAITKITKTGNKAFLYSGGTLLSFVNPDSVAFSAISVYKKDSVSPTAGSYTSRYDFEKENPTPDLLYSLQLMGSDLKGLPIAPSLPTTYTAMEDSVVHFTAIYIPKGGAITGVHVGMANVTGNYVASSTGFNGVAMYTTNGTTLTLVAQSANTKNNWTGNAYEGKDIPFTTPYTATAGVYWIGIYMNYITSTTVPALMSAAAFNAGHASSLKTGSTGSTVYVSCKKVNVATLQATVTLSTLTGNSYSLYTTVY